MSSPPQAPWPCNCAVQKRRPAISHGPSCFDFDFVERLPLGWCLRSADDEPPSHELLVVEFADGAPGFFDRVHGYKAEALGLFGLPMGDNLGILHFANAVEELKQVALAGVK